MLLKNHKKLRQEGAEKAAEKLYQEIEKTEFVISSPTKEAYNGLKKLSGKVLTDYLSNALPDS